MQDFINQDNYNDYAATFIADGMIPLPYDEWVRAQERAINELEVTVA